MKRRNFLKQFGKASVIATAGGLTVSAAESIRSKADETSQDLAQQFAMLKKKVDAMESGQKNLIKALCIITAYSTGIDLTLLI